jgi:hypothetical protein
MSKRHQSTRRRAYGRRQHELHQRQHIPLLGTWIDRETEVHETASPPERWAGGDRAPGRLGFGYGD